MKRFIFIFAVVLILAGCGNISTLQGFISRDAAKAADNTLKAGAWAVCPGSSNGAVDRRYDDDQEEIWDAFCDMERKKAGD